jgi:ribonuclease J
MASITVYDGAETIGGNKIYVEEKGRGIFFDFGMNFALNNTYFDEFLRERDTRGIHDLLCLNMIPKLNIYRHDLIPSDLDREVAAFPKLNVEAVLLSHAHMDHCGNIALLDEKIPVVASTTSLAILKAMRDVSPAKMCSDLPYMSIRKRLEGGMLLKSESSGEYTGRDLACPCKPPERLQTFIAEKPTTSASPRKKLAPGKLCEHSELELPFEIEAYNVDHSIYGAVAYVLRSDSTAIAYSGDFRINGREDDEIGRFIHSAKSASTMIVEGTRAGRDNDHEVTEKDVYANCLKAVEETKGLVIADFSARNFERLETFMQIARKTGRQLVITSKDAYMLYAIQCADRACPLTGVLVYDELKEKKNAWDSVVEDRLGMPYVTCGEIAGNPGNYIVCFSFFDMKHMLDIKPCGGTYIYSSSEAFSEEQEIDFKKLKHWLDRFRIKPCGFDVIEKDGNVTVNFDKGYHCSGHASKESLEKVIDSIDPDIIIPVHTTNVEWFEERFEHVHLLKQGETFKLS